MNAIDFTPLYRSTVGFDRLANLLDSALQHNHTSGYPLTTSRRLKKTSTPSHWRWLALPRMN